MIIIIFISLVALTVVVISLFVCVEAKLPSFPCRRSPAKLIVLLLYSRSFLLPICLRKPSIVKELRWDLGWLLLLEGLWLGELSSRNRN